MKGLRWSLEFEIRWFDITVVATAIAAAVDDDGDGDDEFKCETDGVERIFTSSAVDIRMINERSSRISTTWASYTRLLEKCVAGRSKMKTL